MPLGPSLGRRIAHHHPASCPLLTSLGLAGAPALPSHCFYTAALLTLGGALLHLSRTRQDALVRCRHELAVRKELLAYLLFSGSPPTIPAARSAASSLIAAPSAGSSIPHRRSP